MENGQHVSDRFAYRSTQDSHILVGDLISKLRQLSREFPMEFTRIKLIVDVDFLEVVGSLE